MESDWNSTCGNDDGGSRLSSVLQKTVCLYSWWLTKAEADHSGRRLAVGGITSREKEPVRTFSSAPIVKRYDVFTLETADGICVILKGFVNKSLTSGNDFPEEAFKHFVFGFPPNWELYAVNCFESVDFSTAAVFENIAEPNKSASPLIRSEVGTRSDSCCLSKEKPQGSKEDTDQHLACKSDGIISSNLSVKKPVIPTSVHGHHMSVQCQSAKKSDANLRRNHDDIVTQGDEEFKNSSMVPISPGGPVNTKHNRDSKIPASLEKTKRKLHFHAPETPVTQPMKGQKGIISPECLSYGRSRSGRLLVPTLEFWRNQLPVYNANRRLTGIQEGHIPSGSCTDVALGSQPKRQAMVGRSRSRSRSRSKQ